MACLIWVTWPLPAGSDLIAGRPVYVYCQYFTVYGGNTYFRPLLSITSPPSPNPPQVAALLLGGPCTCTARTSQCMAAV
jgi:hypothetical protein